MLSISDENPKMIKFDKALGAKKYAPNTKRLYKWQGKKFLAAMQEKKVKAQDLDRAAILYLQRLRRAHSRTYFLQACSSIELLLEKVEGRPFKKDVLRKLQSAA